MTRCLPVSKIKTTKKGKHFGASLGSVPRDGTKIRGVYDHFQSHKGVVCVFKAGNHRVIADLIDYYGLDLRRVGQCKWLLAGEWFGRVYVDYVAERLETAQ